MVISTGCEKRSHRDLCFFVWETDNSHENIFRIRLSTHSDVDVSACRVRLFLAVPTSLLKGIAKEESNVNAKEHVATTRMTYLLALGWTSDGSSDRESRHHQPIEPHNSEPRESTKPLFQPFSLPPPPTTHHPPP